MLVLFPFGGLQSGYRKQSATQTPQQKCRLMILNGKEPTGSKWAGLQFELPQQPSFASKGRAFSGEMATLIGAFQTLAGARPEHVALRWLADDGSELVVLSFGEVRHAGYTVAMKCKCRSQDCALQSAAAAAAAAAAGGRGLHAFLLTAHVSVGSFVHHNCSNLEQRRVVLPLVLSGGHLFTTNHLPPTLSPAAARVPGCRRGQFPHRHAEA